MIPRRFWMRLLLLGLLVGVSYARLLSNGWLNWDDPDYITANPLLTNADGWRRIWGSFESPQYYPLTFTLLRVERGLFGEHAGGYHVVSLVFHIVNVWLLVRLLERGCNPFCALSGGALFALHPIQVATVAWAAEQKTLLAAAFVLGAGLCYRDPRSHRGRRAYAGSLVLYAAALLSKTQPLLLPFLFPLLAREGSRDRPRFPRASAFSLRSLALGLLPLSPFLLLGLGGAAATTLHERAPLYEGGLDLAGRIALAGQSFWFGLKSVALPIGLSALYPKWDLEATRFSGLLSAIGALLVFGFVVRSAMRGSRGGARAFLWYALPWLPASGLLTFGYLEKAYVADHLLYFSMAGPASLFALILDRLTRSPGTRRRLVIGTTVTLLAGCAIASAARLPSYRDSEVFWRHVLVRNEGSPTAHSNLAVELATRGAVSEAIEHWRTALVLRPSYYDARMNLARAFESEGRTVEAIAEYEAALRAVPGDARARERLTALRPANLKSEGDAEANWRASPKDLHATARWTRVLIDQGRLEEAIAVARAALLDSDAGVSSAALWLELGYALVAARRLEEATEAYRRAVALTPANADARMNLGVVLRARGQFEDAVVTLEAALALAPSDPRILGNLEKARRRQR